MWQVVPLIRPAGEVLRTVVAGEVLRTVVRTVAHSYRIRRLPATRERRFVASCRAVRDVDYGARSTEIRRVVVGVAPKTESSFYRGVTRGLLSRYSFVDTQDDSEIIKVGD